MITPSQTKRYSPYSLGEAQSDMFWALENAMTAALRDFQGAPLEFAVPPDMDDHTVQVLCYHLSDHGWSALWDVQRRKLIVYPRPVRFPAEKPG